MEYLQGLKDIKIPSKTQTLLFIFSDSYEKKSEINISQHIQAECFRQLSFLEYIELEKGACGRYNDNTTVKTLICYYFYNIEMEKGACGCYINRQTCMI